jgi:subtilisin family serine protease
MTWRSASMLCALWLAVASPLTFRASAAPESARTPAGLELAAARKLDPILWRALAAADVAARGSAPAGESLWLALTPGAGSSAAGPVVDLLVRMQDAAAPGAAVLQAHDLVPDAVVGSIATLHQVPLAKVADLARDPAIAHLQPARSYHTMNDVSVPETGAPEVWSKHGYTGQGVLVAIIDTGIDPDHPDFQHANGTTRIRYLLDLADPGSGPLGGTLYTESQINAGPIPTTDLVGHGTHVAGTAAGNGSATPAFSGMAPEADLIIVNASRAGNGSFSSTDIVNSLAFVDAQAATLGLPYVANLSLGGHDGAHDGTALEEVAIDNLIGEGKAGKAVVIAAGNDRSGESRHAQANVNAGGLNLRLNVPDYTPQPGTFNDYAVVHVWYEASSDFRITFTSPTGHSFGSFNPNEWNGESGENTNQGLVGVANALGGVSSENGDREVEIIIIDGDAPPAEGNWQVRFDGDTGPIDAYVAQSTFGAAFIDYATPGGFVAEPGTARNAITVGAYVTKIAWTDIDDHQIDLGQPPFNLEIGPLAVFSNAGPTRDGRLKPEIAAPGQEIASTYTPDAPPTSAVSAYQSPFPQQYPNFFLLPGGQYAIQQGTSQAAPHVTGAVELLLQQNPDWDQLDLRRALTSSARADAFTGTVPNQGFGYGKLDVLAAVVGAKTPGLPPDGDVSGDLDVDLEDIQLAIGFVLGNSTPTVDQEARADMNRDHLLNVGDVVLIVRASLAGGLAGAPAPADDHGTAPWWVPVTVVPEVKGAQVSGLDLTLAAGSAAIAGSVRPGADGILALDAPRPDGGRRVIALSTDGSDLAQRTAFLVPVATESAALALRQIELIAPNGKSVSGTIRLGAPLPPAAPQRLAIATLRPEPGRGPRTIVVDVPSSIAPGGLAAGAASAGNARSVTVAIYDASGRHVRTLTRNPLAPGRHELEWDGRGARGPVAAGVYWVRLALGSEIVSARLTVLK